MHRRTLLMSAAGLVVATSSASATEVYAIDVRRDAGCGCCHTWTEVLARSGRLRPTLTNETDMSALKERLGVPRDLASCHTGIAGEYVVEGHVPAADIVRLLETRPAGVRGIAVPGMPIGSPGMEHPSGRRDAFDVVAFHRDGSRSIWARYAAQ